MSKYKYKQKIIRIRYADYLAIRKVFPGEKGETMVNYFRRFAKWKKLQN